MYVRLRLLASWLFDCWRRSWTGILRKRELRPVVGVRLLGVNNVAIFQPLYVDSPLILGGPRHVLVKT